MEIIAEIQKRLLPIYTGAIEAKGENGFEVVKSTVCLYILNYLYEVFLKDGLTGIEGLSIANKKKYYAIASLYYQEKEDKIKATKAIYTLALITSIHND